MSVLVHVARSQNFAALFPPEPPAAQPHYDERSMLGRSSITLSAAWLRGERDRQPARRQRTAIDWSRGCAGGTSGNVRMSRDTASAPVNVERGPFTGVLRIQLNVYRDR